MMIVTTTLIILLIMLATFLFLGIIYPIDYKFLVVFWFETSPILYLSQPVSFLVLTVWVSLLQLLLYFHSENLVYAELFDNLLQGYGYNGNQESLIVIRNRTQERIRQTTNFTQDLATVLDKESEVTSSWSEL